MQVAQAGALDAGQLLGAVVKVATSIIDPARRIVRASLGHGPIGAGAACRAA